MLKYMQQRMIFEEKKMLIQISSCLGQSTVSPGATPSPSSVTCDFESSNLCEWKNDKTDNFDWTWKSGSTSTTNTGPTNDHSTNTASGKQNVSTVKHGYSEQAYNALILTVK